MTGSIAGTRLVRLRRAWSSTGPAVTTWCWASAVQLEGPATFEALTGIGDYPLLTPSQPDSTHRGGYARHLFLIARQQPTPARAAMASPTTGSPPRCGHARPVLLARHERQYVCATPQPGQRRHVCESAAAFCGPAAAGSPAAR